MFHKIWVITKEQIAKMLYPYEIQHDSERLLYCGCFGISLKLKNKSIRQKYYPAMLAADDSNCMGNVNTVEYEMIQSQTENSGQLFICTKGATKMHFLYRRGNQQSEVMLSSTTSLYENRANQNHLQPLSNSVEHNSTPHDTISPGKRPPTPTTAHLSQGAFSEAWREEMPFCNPTSNTLPHPPLLSFSFPPLVLFEQTRNFKILRAKIIFLKITQVFSAVEHSFRHTRSL